MSTDTAPAPRNDRSFFVLNAAVSLVALAIIAYLLLVQRARPNDWNVAFLPSLNALFNGTSAVLLVLGYRAIRKGQRTRHYTFMLAAFASSLCFLVGYLVYHYAHGDSHYGGVARPLYLFILISHVLLSLPVVPMVLTTFYFAATDKLKLHKRIARITLPIWLYVSVTGVVVYAFLRYGAATNG